MAPMASSMFKLNLGSSIRQVAASDIIRLTDFFLSGQGRVLAITGAGVSTESGIPDYRSPTGSYSRGHKPTTHQDFMKSHAKRQRYWARSAVAWGTFGLAAPNNGHSAITDLHAAGQLSELITQNVDRLHHQSGFPSHRILELHGNNDEVVCMGCGTLYDRHEHQRTIARINQDWLARNVQDAGEIRADGDADAKLTSLDEFKVPDCTLCGGIIKPHVVFFGGAVPVPVKERAFDMVKRADRMLLIGTSCSTWSCFRLVKQAAEEGKPIAMINVGETRADPLCSHKVEGSAGEVLCAVRDALNIQQSDAQTTKPQTLPR